MEAPAIRWGVLAPGRHRQHLRGCRARGHPLAGRRRRARGRRSGRRSSPSGTAWSGRTGRTPTSSPTPTWMPCTSPARTASTTSTPCSRCARASRCSSRRRSPATCARPTRCSAAAEAAGLLAAEAMWSRYLPHYDVIRRTVEAGTLGDVVLVDADHGQLLWPDGPARLSQPELAGGRAARPRRLPGLVRRPRARRPRGRRRAAGTLTDLGVDATTTIAATRAGRQRRGRRPPVVLDGGGDRVPGPGGGHPGPARGRGPVLRRARAGCGSSGRTRGARRVRAGGGDPRVPVRGGRVRPRPGRGPASRRGRCRGRPPGASSARWTRCAGRWASSTPANEVHRWPALGRWLR